MSKKGKALDPLVVDYIDGKRWRLRFQFRWKFRDGVILYVAPFTYDFNSIPRLFWRVVPPVKYGEAGTVHDWLYHNNGEVVINDANGKLRIVTWTREECDLRYREILRDTGAMLFTASIMYRAVRFGGRKAWNNHKKGEKKMKKNQIKSIVAAYILAFGSLFAGVGCQTIGERDLAVKVPVTYATLKVIDNDVNRAQQVYDVTTAIKTMIDDGVLAIVDIDKVLNEQIPWEKLDAGDKFLVVLLIDELKLQIDEYIEDGKINKDHAERVSVLLNYVASAAKLSGAR